MAPEAEELCEFHEIDLVLNLSVSGGVNPQSPKTATPSEALAVLAIDQDFCASQGGSSPKTATPSCGEHPKHAAAQQCAADTEDYETDDCATSGYPMCCECGVPITERLETWWGGEQCHRACGEAAFQRAKASRRAMGGTA
jgi:hypothetical protein